jgi:hypothetical protein
MPLYLEILDHSLSVTKSSIQDDADLSILAAWTSETTGERVRLIDAPAGQAPVEFESPRATARFMRILCF